MCNNGVVGWAYRAEICLFCNKVFRCWVPGRLAASEADCQSTIFDSSLTDLIQLALVAVERSVFAP